MKKIKINKTKSGRPALWEWGGGYSNTGEATIITGRNGEPLKPYYIRRRGELANSCHALLPLMVGGYIIEAKHHREDFVIKVFKVTKIDLNELRATLKSVAEFSYGEWDKPLPKFLEAAVNAAKEKATCYHCRCSHYIKELNN